MAFGTSNKVGTQEMQIGKEEVLLTESLQLALKFLLLLLKNGFVLPQE